MRQEEVHSLESLSENGEVVINCSGVWASQLVDDKEVYPIRGQVVVAERLDSLPGTIVVYDDGETPTYVVPRSNDCILGGTAQVGNWEPNPDPETASEIRTRCEMLNPLVASMETVKHKVGLRPGRNKVRLEREVSPTGVMVIHNYGHGGSGFTLSWGCADEVVSLIRG